MPRMRGGVAAVAVGRRAARARCARAPAPRASAAPPSGVATAAAGGAAERARQVLRQDLGAVAHHHRGLDRRAAARARCRASRAAAGRRAPRRRGACSSPNRSLSAATKCPASRSMSPRRSRSGGSSQRDRAHPVVQVLAEQPLPHHGGAGRGWWPRARARPRGSRLVPPTWRNVDVSSTRSSLTCVAGLTSPISSRKIVPPCATSNRPGLARSAPVNAPRSWPNSSLCSRLSCSAAHSTTTNGRSRARAARVDQLGDHLLARARSRP